MPLRLAGAIARATCACPSQGAHVDVTVVRKPPMPVMRGEAAAAGPCSLPQTHAQLTEMGAAHFCKSCVKRLVL